MAQLESSCCVFVGEGCGILREKDDAAGRPAAPWLPALSLPAEPVPPASLTSTADGHTSTVVSCAGTGSDGLE